MDYLGTMQIVERAGGGLMFAPRLLPVLVDGRAREDQDDDQNRSEEKNNTPLRIHGDKLPAFTLFPTVSTDVSGKSGKDSNGQNRERRGCHWLHRSISFFKKIGNNKKYYIESRTNKQAVPIDLFRESLPKDKPAERKIGQVHEFFSKKGFLSRVKYVNKHLIERIECQDENEYKHMCDITDSYFEDEIRHTFKAKSL